MEIAHAPRVRLVVCDWAGTLIDHGSCAPVVAFRAMFARHRVYVTDEQVRAFLGLDKRAHIEAMLGDAEICEQWQDYVLDTMYELPALIDAGPRRSERGGSRLALRNHRRPERAFADEAPGEWH